MEDAFEFEENVEEFLLVRDRLDEMEPIILPIIEKKYEDIPWTAMESTIFNEYNLLKMRLYALLD
jgi:hypothetical protein